MSKNKNKRRRIRVLRDPRRSDILRLAWNIAVEHRALPSPENLEPDDLGESANLTLRLGWEHVSGVRHCSDLLGVSDEAVVRGLISTYLVGMDDEMPVFID